MLIAAALTAAKSDAVGKAGDALGQGIAGILGDTRTDKARKDRISSLRAQALAGDDAAVVALCYEAFEPRRGLPNDPRLPVDGKRSPEAVRDGATGALRAYVQKFGGLPSAAAQWSEQLSNAPILSRSPSIADMAATALREGARQGVSEGARAEIASTTSMTWAKVKPYAMLGALALGVFLVVRYTRK